MVRVLEIGEVVLLRFVLGFISDEEVVDGVVVLYNLCLSGGLLEIFFELQFVLLCMVIFGDMLIVCAMVEFVMVVGYEVGGELGEFDVVLIVVSYGEGEEFVLVRALEVGVLYVGFVVFLCCGVVVVGAFDVLDALCV